MESSQECVLSEWNKFSDDMMTFTESETLENLEDGSRQTRRLPQLEPKNKINQIPGEVVSIESGRSPEQVRTVPRQSEDLSL